MSRSIIAILFLVTLLSSFFTPEATAAITTLQTDHKKCFNSYTTINCNGTGQDGEYRAGMAWPNPRFVTNADQTVKDKLTGLIWSKNANPGFISRAWRFAYEYIKSLNDQNYLGHSDWRLPNVNELLSLQQGDTAFLQAFNFNFPTDVAADWGFWSTTSSAADPQKAWQIFVGSNTGYYRSKWGDGWVWPVRSEQAASLTLPWTGQNTCYDSAGVTIDCASTGQDGDLQKGVPWPSHRFTVSANEIVVDNLTGLSWSKNANPAGRTFPEPEARENSLEAIDYIKTLNNQNYLGYNDWRLPNINELASLINWQEANPATWLNLQGFTNVQSGTYWSSTPFHPYRYSLSASVLDLSFGGAIYYTRLGTNRHFVWPVRGGQVAVSCGSANGGAFTTAPTINLCNASTASAVTATSTGWDWTCSTGSGAASTCSASAISFTVNYAAGANGSITGSTSQTVAYGSDAATVTAVPANGYHFVSWTEGSTIVGTSAALTIANITADHSYQANFAPNSFALTFSSAGNGTIAGSTSQTVEYGGSSTTVTAVPVSYYHFVNWTENTTIVGSDAAFTVSNVTADHHYTANFAINTSTISFTVGGNGTIVGNTSQIVNYGTDAATVTAVPGIGSYFVNWTEGTTIIGTDAVLTISRVIADHNIRANFAVLPVNGVCGISNGGIFTVAPTTDFCMTGTASTLSGTGPWNWQCNGFNGGTNAVCSANIQVYTVTPVPVAHCSISPEIPQTIKHGNTARFTFVPEVGYGVLVNGCGGALYDNSYTTGAISGDCFVRVTTISRNAHESGAVQPSIVDAQKAFNAYAGKLQLSPAEKIRYDVAPLGINGVPVGNGIVDLADIILILRRTVGIGTW